MDEKTNQEKRLKRRMFQIDWKKGAGTAMYYLMILVLISTAVVLFSEYLHAYQSIGKTQVMADILADGSIYVGNTGWGIDQKKTKGAYATLLEQNQKEFPDAQANKNPKIVYLNSDNKEGKAHKDKGDKENFGNNTVIATTTSTATTLTTGQRIGKEKSRTKKATAQIAYSGGMKIVLEAYRHTYEYEQLGHSGAQTAYVWGGGHNGNPNEWTTYADCSGFVDGVYRACGYDIGYGATGALENTGRTIIKTSSFTAAANAAQLGDIILFWYGGNAPGLSKHAVIYAGKLNGVDYDVECKGGRVLHTYDITRSNRPTGEQANCGPAKGAHVAVMNRSCSCYQVIRVVKGSGKAYKPWTPNYSNMSPNEIAVYNALSLYFPPKACFSIMGNWACESGNDPTALEGVFSSVRRKYYANAINSGRINKETFCLDKRGYGIAQWTTTQSDWKNDRKAKLWDFAKTTGNKVTDLGTQMAFVAKEFIERGQYYPLLRIASTQGPEAGAEYVYKYFEIPPETDTSLPKRKAAARRLAS